MLESFRIDLSKFLKRKLNRRSEWPSEEPFYWDVRMIEFLLLFWLEREEYKKTNSCWQFCTDSMVLINTAMKFHHCFSAVQRWTCSCDTSSSSMRFSFSPVLSFYGSLWEWWILVEGGSDQRRLIRYLLHDRDHSALERPVKNDSQTLPVTMNLALQQIIEFVSARCPRANRVLFNPWSWTTFIGRKESNHRHQWMDRLRTSFE